METETLVIGGGPAGYTAAIRSAQLGFETTLVEDGNIGGTCLNTGCIPSKSLLSATRIVAEADQAEPKGIYIEPYVDFGEMIEWKNDVVDDLTGGVEHLLENAGVRLVSGRARFPEEESVVVDDEVISFDDAILATGSRPLELPQFSFADEPILDAAQALSLDRVPPRLVVIGAGYIGMELSTVFARLGTDVTAVEQFDTALPQYDEALTAPVEQSLHELGVTFEFGAKATGWDESGNEVRVTTEEKNGSTTEYMADAILVAVGRVPVVDGLDVDEAGIKRTDGGFIQTNDVGQTNRENVYSIGDVAGDPMLAHAGIHEATVAVDAISGRDPEPSALVPEVVFTDPEIATVGATPADIKAVGDDPIVGRFPFSASGRAKSAGHTDGFVRLVAESDGRLVGGQIIGPEASEMIGEVTTAIAAAMTIEELEQVIHAHPTLSEAIAESAGQALGRAIHTPNR